MGSWVIEAFGSWYPIVYPHRDGAEACRLVETLRQVVPFDGERTLDIGCGSGRHLVHFQKSGASPVGMDLSPALLAEARRVRAELGERWPLVRGDMRELPFGPGTFGGVTSLFTSFGYFGRPEDQRVLEEAARVLKPGGFHVLDFLNRERVLAHPNPESERISGDYRIRERRVIEGGGQRIVKRVTISPAGGGAPLTEYEERVTLYTRGELESLLRAAGLRVRFEWGEYDGASFDPARSSRHVLVSLKESG